MYRLVIQPTAVSSIGRLYDPWMKTLPFGQGYLFCNLEFRQVTPKKMAF